MGSEPRKTGKRGRTGSDGADRTGRANGGEEPGVSGSARATRERLELLFDVSKLLTRFESVKRDVLAVLTLVGDVLPLRTAVLVLGEPGAPVLGSLWAAAGTSAGRQEAATAHARGGYARLARDRGSIAFDAGAASALAVRGAPAKAEVEGRFIMLPLVIAGGPVFGALQVEGIAPLDENDLAFVNALVNQLAVAIDRQRALEAHREAAEARQVDAERGRAQAEALHRRYQALVDNLDRAFVWEAAAPEDRLTYASGRAAELLGFDAWVGQRFVERVHPDDREAVQRALADVVSHREDRSVEHRMLARDGAVRWFHTGVHLAGAGTEAPSFQGVSVEVTAAHDAAARVAEQLDFTWAVTDSLGEGVLAVDRELALTFLNPAAEAMLAAGARALGQPVADVLRITRADGSPLRAEERPLTRVIESGEPLREDGLFFGPPGAAPFPVSYTASPLRRAGEVTGAVLVFRDLLEVRRAEREQRFLAETSELLSASLEVRATLSRLARSAVPLLADLCVVDEVDERGRVVNVDVALAGPEREPLAERVRRSRPSTDGTGPFARALRERRALLVRDVPPCALAPEEASALGPSSMIVVPLIARGRALGALELWAADPGHRQGERELRFAEEVGRRAALALDNARLYEKAQRETRARQELLALVSHDLRNPLGSIVMATQVLLDETPPPPGELRRGVELIRRASLRASGLVEDLLDIGNIESGLFAIHPSAEALAPLLEEAIDEHRAVAAESGLRLALSPPPPIDVRCDRRRIVQVLGNLLANAIKFTPRGGSVTVSASKRGSAAEVHVSDTGIGISADALPHVFDRFWQVRHTGRAGAGLGLAIAQGLVRAHGGALWAESTPGVGSTFAFTLPLAEGAGDGAAGTKPRAAS